jgi:hypothetical protein
MINTALWNIVYCRNRQEDTKKLLLLSLERSQHC